jgi:hypothetical protein
MGESVGQGPEAIFDWRAAAATTLAADWTSPWTGVTHAVGAPVSKVTPGRDERRRPLTFTSPSPEALALDLAFAATARARSLRDMVPVKPQSNAWDTSFEIVLDDLPALYDYFEECLVVVTFAYQAIEMFANREIDGANPRAPLEITQRGKRTTIQPDHLERNLSLGEKVDQLLPVLLGVPTPKGRKPWPGFRALQTERDAIVHLKADDASPREAMKKQSIFHRFWVEGVGVHATNAVALMDWFYVGREAPRWLHELRLRASAAASRSLTQDGLNGSNEKARR